MRGGGGLPANTGTHLSSPNCVQLCDWRSLPGKGNVEKCVSVSLNVAH